MHCKARKRGKKSRKPRKRKKAWGAARKRQEQATSSNPVTHHQRIMSLVRIKKKDPEKEIIKHAIDAKHANDANHSIILIA